MSGAGPARAPMSKGSRHHVRGALAARVVALAFFVAAGCGRGEHPLRAVERGEAVGTGRGVLVIAIDGLRYDRTSLGRTDLDTTPFLARLAREGVELGDTWSPIALRYDAHVALLTGCDPVIGRRPAELSDARRSEPSALPLVVPERAPSLAVRFLAGGWTTAAFVDHPDLAQVRGLDRGFRDFREYAGRGHGGDHRGDGVFGVGARFIEWLNTRALDEDWFAYVHMADLERASLEATPSDAGTPGDSVVGGGAALPVGRVEPVFHALPASRVPRGAARVEDLARGYDAALTALDQNLERIVRLVDQYGRRERVTLVVVGAYGVPFGESGLYLTPGLPDGPDLRVPWVVRPATSAPGGPRVVDGVASLIDVAPTLLEHVGLPVPPAMHGFAWSSALRGEPAPTPRRFLYARGHVGGGATVVSEAEQWGVLTPARVEGPLAESWTGSREAAPDLLVHRLVPRTGPRACDSLRFAAPAEVDPARRQEFAARWDRWSRLTTEVRDALHFGGAATPESLAEGLRAMQRE